GGDPFDAGDGPAVDDEADHAGAVVGSQASESADEEVALPLGEKVGVVEVGAGGGDGGGPLDQRGFHPLVVQAVVDGGPAVVVALLDDVELVAAHAGIDAALAAGAVLGLPEEAGFGVPVDALGVAVAEGPDLGAVAGFLV